MAKKTAPNDELLIHLDLDSLLPVMKAAEANRDGSRAARSYARAGSP